jgi:hypothetical protein
MVAVRFDRVVSTYRSFHATGLNPLFSQAFGFAGQISAEFAVS